MAYISFQPSDHYNTTIYTGTGGVQTITGVGFQPDFTWIKDRDVTKWHCQVDTVRGYSKYIYSNATSLEATVTDRLTSWNSDGFVLGAGVETNTNTNNLVSWNWKAGTTTGIAGSPDITPSSYSFNQTAGFSIIAYTGSGSAGDTIPHGLGVAPKMVIIKRLDSGSAWVCYHERIDATAPEDYHILLNANAVRVDSTGGWNDTAPSSTLITLGGDNVTSSGTFIAYCFADIKGYSKFGSYEGTGDADGPFIYTGFRPAFFLLKSATAVENWYMLDNKRLGYNDANRFLFPDETAVEIAKTNSLLSNGVKMGTPDGSTNGSGQTFIYAAFAEFPLVSSNDVPGVAR